MNPQNKPGMALGALTGLLTTTPLLIVLFIGSQMMEVSFPPYILFDEISRVLPGSFITFGIDTMVHTIRALNLANTATAAKTAEKFIALINFVIAGTIAGSFYFSIMKLLNRKFSLVLSLGLSILLGAAILYLIHNIHKEPTLNPIIEALWIIVVFSIWGLALGWIYQHLLPVNNKIISDDEKNFTIDRIGRRKFLINLGGAVAVITVFGTILGKNVRSRKKLNKPNSEMFWSSHNPLPNINDLVKPAPGTRPEFTPVAHHYRIDINTSPPEIQEESWRLKISGLVEKPLSLTLNEIRSYDPLHQFITLSCISNPVGGDLIGTTRWTGVSLKHLLPKFKLLPNATHLMIRSADGFYECLTLDEIQRDDRVMLTYAWDGVPLTTEHGFPLRIYIPNVYGMKQPKWIESIEVIDHWEEGYWVSRGWDKYALMKSTSVIDTISIEKPGNRGIAMIPVGGIAHAGTRGISKVEVQVDDGPWADAKLRTPLSGQTWVIWRYDWPFQKGKHTFTVRCYDGEGIPQITEEAEPHPNGASGLHSRSLKSHLGFKNDHMKINITT